MRTARVRRGRVRGFLHGLVWSALTLLLCFSAFVILSLLALRIMNPPFTAVQVERRMEAWLGKKPYTKRYTPVPGAQISEDLKHAVVAAEDSRFFQHNGFDWVEIEKAIDEEDERGRLRGASTITQQLVKNLYLTTSRSFVRKGLEAALTPPAEWILGKRRILELYLNVIEWGPGVYGAEAAARYHYSVPAARLNRDQAARLAAVIPSPKRRKPARMDRYSALILARMVKMGW